ncbi:MAG TPA: hypothetical protein VLR90_04435, partial [Blastocatellia bacterium]|nr:hypothetical protein [Blastocatellia bacterium]
MKKSWLSLSIILLLIAQSIVFSETSVNARATQSIPMPKREYEDTKKRDAEVQETTLFSRIGHKETGYGKSAFSFNYGLRSDSEEWLSITHNYVDLLYGSISIDGDSDWFCVSAGGENPSKIKDLSALGWSDMETMPLLLA